MTGETISTNELARASGCTLRQLLYWYHERVIDPLPCQRGSGFYLRWPVETVEVCVVLRAISKGLGGAQTTLLRRVVEQFDVGFVELDGRVRLSWPVKFRTGAAVAS